MRCFFARWLWCLPPPEASQKITSIVFACISEWWLSSGERAVSVAGDPDGFPRPHTPTTGLRCGVSGAFPLCLFSKNGDGGSPSTPVYYTGRPAELYGSCLGSDGSGPSSSSSPIMLHALTGRAEGVATSGFVTKNCRPVLRGRRRLRC